MKKLVSTIYILLAVNVLTGLGQNGTANITPLGQCAGSDNPSFILNSVTPSGSGPFAGIVYDVTGTTGQALSTQIHVGDTVMVPANLDSAYYVVLSEWPILNYFYSDTISIGQSTGASAGPLVFVLSGESFLWVEAGIDTILCAPGDHQIIHSTIIDQYGCTADTSQFVHVDPYIPSICVVTDQDNNGHNEIVFDISGGADYNIYRGSTYLTTRQSTDNNYYEDEAVSNSEFAYTYSIEAVDGCGTSPASNGHTTIKLTTGSAPDSNTVNLSWNPYEGIEFTNESYVIERTRNQQTDSIWGIPAVDYNQSPTPVTLPGHQAGDIYQVVVELQLTCTPQRSEAPAIRSNLLNPNATGIEDAEAINIMLPNPSDGLHLQCDRILQVTVTDINGRQIASYQGVAVVNEWYRSGMYIVSLTDGTHTVTKRLVVTR